MSRALTEDDIRAIRSLFISGANPVGLARAYKVANEEIVKAIEGLEQIAMLRQGREER